MLLLHFYLLLIILIFIFKYFDTNNRIIISLLILVSFSWYHNIDNFSNVQNNYIDNEIVNNVIKNRDKLQSLIKTYKKDRINKINIPIYYINLDKSIDRKEFMEKQFKDYNITDYKRVSGVYGKNITNTSESTVDGIKFKNHNPELSLSEIGCTLSHLKAIKLAFDNNEKMVVIMEDDCSLELMPLFDSDLKNIISQNIPKDWGIAQLFTLNCQKVDKYDNYVFADLPQCKNHSSCAYVVNRKGMEIMLNKYYDKKTNTFLVYGPADLQLFDNTKTYFINIPLFIPADELLPSTIHLDHQNYHLNSINEVLIKYIYKIENQIK